MYEHTEVLALTKINVLSQEGQTFHLPKAMQKLNLYVQTQSRLATHLSQNLRMCATPPIKGMGQGELTDYLFTLLPSI